MNVSRRDLFAIFARRHRPSIAPDPRRSETDLHVDSPVPVASAAVSPVSKVAIIQGRRCIALTSFCSVCIERCPVPGAMTSHQGMPMVVADVCTGCGVCHDVCPAPANAVLMLNRRPAPSTRS